LELVFWFKRAIQDQWIQRRSINQLGGKQSLRGYRANRFFSSLWFTNVELRYRIAEAKLGKQRFSLVLPFFDAGTVRDV
jgi:hemolysin activation/secretion protein